MSLIGMTINGAPAGLPKRAVTGAKLVWAAYPRAPVLGANDPALFKTHVRRHVGQIPCPSLGFIDSFALGQRDITHAEACKPAAAQFPTNGLLFRTITDDHEFPLL